MSRPRIIAGSAKGRELNVAGRETRPTPAVVREALFSILAPEPRGAFLDLYAGSGAVGLEAASRGWEVTLVERDAAAARVLRANALRLGLAVEVHTTDAERFVERGARFDVVFAGPPYRFDPDRAQELALRAAVPGGIVVVQHAARVRLARGEPRVYGSNAVTMLRRTTAPEEC